MRRVVFILSTVALSLTLLAAGLETLARLSGATPWRPTAPSITVEPGGRLYERDPLLGYRHLPGKYRVVLSGRHAFTMTHDSHGRRITSGRDMPSAARKEIWIFGCSFTHGWSVNDSETYPWLLQEEFPQYHIVNFGVGGYGTIHSLLQFEQAIKTHDPPIAVVVAYAYFHDERNVFSRYRQKVAANWSYFGPLVQPFGRVDANGNLQLFMASTEFQEFPLMRWSAFSSLMEQKYSAYHDARLEGRVVTEAIFRRLQEDTRAHGIPLLIAEIDGKSGIAVFARKNGIAYADIGVDLNTPGARNFPFDPHPTARTHREYARKLGAALRPLVEGM
jgi:hypothetical protein